MAVAPNTGMTKQDMKRLLMRSKEEPVKCAIGQGDIGGLMVLHKTKQPRALETELKAEFPDARNTRFGSAFVDVDDNPKLVKLTLNKPVTGMAKRLIKTLKGTGFTKVMILTEDGSLMEQFEEADPEAEAEVAAAAGVAVPAAPATPVPPATPEAATEAESGPTAAELSARLATLAARIPAVSAGDAARQEQLAKLARQGNVEIKTNNLRYAANTLAQLERALGAPPPPAPPPPPPGAAPADNAARAAALSKELAELVSGIAAASAGDPVRQAELAKLARDANIQIKTGNLTYAANAVEQLRKALAVSTGAPPPPAPPPPPPGATPQQKTDDAAGLSKQLGALIPGIAAAANGDAARQAELTKLAKDANIEIKTGNLTYATNTIARLRAAMEAGAPGAPANDAIPASRITWTNMRQEIAADVEKLRAALAQAYAGETFAAEVEKQFQAKIAPMLGRFDDRLDGALDQLAKAPPAQREEAAAGARGYVRDYRAFAESDPFIESLDTNPFVPLQIRSRATAALAQVERALG